MTDHNNHLPFDIQIEIINRLPVKSLIQFRSVSKAWKTLIDSKEFITGHSLRHTHPQKLTVLYYKHDPVPRHKYLTFLDDQTFPQHRFVPTFPQSVEELYSPRIVSSSQGLLCLFGFCTDPNSWSVNHKAVIWNPSIRKAVMPDVCFSWYDTVIGFGVSPVTGDPTIVEISGDKYMSTRVVRVFKLSTGAWKNLSNNLPKQTLTWSQVVVDKFIYLLGYNRITETETTHCNLILSFDMTNDKFGVVELPEHLALKTDEDLVISKLQESLVVLEYSLDSHVCDVWVMENGVHTSFKKLFTIKEPNAIIRIVGFNKSGYPIMEIGYVGEELQETALSFYDPASEQIIDLGINGREDHFYMNTYVETLLLLDQRESSI